MRETKIERTARFFNRMSELGFSYSEAQSLRRIEMTLQRWAELECGDGNEWASWSIERDETTGKPFKCVYPHKGENRRYPVPDREKGALERLRKIMAKHPALWAYHQGDCRGCMLYIGHRPGIDESTDNLKGWISQNYNRGVAVCI